MSVEISTAAQLYEKSQCFENAYSWWINVGGNSVTVKIYYVTLTTQFRDTIPN